MPEGRYAADDIQVLDSVSAVRARPELYVGDVTSSEVVNGLVLEVLCFAVDVKTGGPATRAEIRVLTDDLVEVCNDGPGLPLGRHPKEGVSLVELILTRLYACRDEKARVEHTRWCDKGIAVVNALSAWCVVTVRREGAVWEQRYERGRAVHELERRGRCADTGTTLRFCLDRTLVTGALDTRRLRASLERFATEVPCTTVLLDDQRPTSTGSA